MSDKPERKDRRELRVRASADMMWRAWADPEIIAGWFADRAAGSAEVGGELIHRFDKFGLELRYRVVESSRPDRLVLEGQTPAGGLFRQEIHIRSEGGETVLELVHSGFDESADWDDEYEGMDSGWKLALALLGHYLERYPGRRRQVYFAARPVDADIAALRPLYATAVGLDRWLTRSANFDGPRWSLDIDGVGNLTGQVLADSGPEIAASWDEIEGALELKAFRAGPATMIALRAHSWAAKPPPIEATERWMAAALERLASSL